MSEPHALPSAPHLERTVDLASFGATPEEIALCIREGTRWDVRTTGEQFEDGSGHVDGQAIDVRDDLGRLLFAGHFAFPEPRTWPRAR